MHKGKPPKRLKTGISSPSHYHFFHFIASRRSTKGTLKVLCCKLTQENAFKRNGKANKVGDLGDAKIEIDCSLQ